MLGMSPWPPGCPTWEWPELTFHRAQKGPSAKLSKRPGRGGPGLATTTLATRANDQNAIGIGKDWVINSRRIPDEYDYKGSHCLESCIHACLRIDLNGG
jgi:hypothetical protein